MPKSTFLNLPEDKKERITEVAIDEFAQHTFLNASINRIVENAGIAKGSFYQYFEDKKDLYKYILEKSGEKKLESIADVMKNMKELDFFSLVRELYAAGVKFSLDSPKLSAISLDFVKNCDSDLKKEIMGNNVPKSNKLFEDLLSDGIDKGDIKRDIDVKLVAYLITSLSISTSEYFINEVKEESDMEIMGLIDKTLDIIKNGIKAKKRPVKNVEDRFY
ncbi:TetR/AcrR family transcriptional regulator [Brassicibacter mesophilus]|uniref:TetR/AcrR family transcriptional regulator n=1 Tax=Brassicibacter mesophilus TaxID=745119 RepID=UPI003D1E8660